MFDPMTMSSDHNYVISETTEILIDLGPMKETVHQTSNQPSNSLITSTYAQKIPPKLLHVCHICDKIFYNRHGLTKHLTKHNIVIKDLADRETTSSVDSDLNNEPNPPNIARDSVSKERDESKVTATGKLSCSYCPKLFAEQTDLTKHEQNLHYLYNGVIMEKHCCGYCGTKFSHRNDLFHHIKGCGTLLFADNKCNLTTEAVVKSKSNKKYSETDISSAKVDDFCLNCKKDSSKSLSLDSASKLLKQGCRNCHKTLPLTYFDSDRVKVGKNQNTLDSSPAAPRSLVTTKPCENSNELMSIEQIQSDTNEPDSLDKIVITDDEEVSTPLENDLPKFYQIIRKFNKKLKFKCSVCYKSFPSLEDLNNHFNSSHIGIERHKCTCPYCSASYITAKLYLRHLQSHVRLKKISCHYQLFSKSSLQQFYDLSDYYPSNDKQYTCLHCSKGFSNSAEVLDHHKVSHPRISLHACQVCSCEFVSEQSLRRHMKKHSINNYYKCDFCVKMFTKRAVLLQHILHHAKTSF